MKYIFLGITLTLAALPSCGHKKSLTVKVGSRSAVVAIGENWRSTQDAVLSEIRPIWDSLSSGTSDIFSMTRVVSSCPDAGAERQANSMPSNSATANLSGTHSSPKWRFFRNRDGISGIEQLDEGRSPLPMIAGASIDWKSVEDYLRTQLITPERIGISRSEQAADGKTPETPQPPH